MLILLYTLLDFNDDNVYEQIKTEKKKFNK